MKTKLSLIIIGLVIAAVLIIPGVSATGNGAESGNHFTLNIIGQKNAKNMPEGLSGHVIFCPLNKGDDVACRIYLSEGDFQVLDKDGTDGVARFMLPRPYPDGTIDPAVETSAYKIYVRVLGKPGGSGSMKTGLCETTDGSVCIDDPLGTWYSATSVELASHSPSTNKQSQKFQDVTHELTTVDLSNYYICGDGTEQCDYHVGLFDTNPFDLDDPASYLYFWDLVNKDMKIIQLRFYPA